MDTKCPVCGGPMWDNREKKAAGTFNPKSPDFTCKDKECPGRIWHADEVADYDEPQEPEPTSAATLAEQARKLAADSVKKATSKDEQPDWDAINRGKVRCQVAVAFLGRGEKVLLPPVISEMEEWVDYIMDGPKT